MKAWGWVGLALAICVPQAATGQEVAIAAAPALDQAIPTAAFASRSALDGASISPDGSRFAFVHHRDGKALIAVVDADTLKPVQTIDVGSVDSFVRYLWAGDDRILFVRQNQVLVHFWLLRRTRLHVFDLTSGKAHAVGFEQQGLEGDDILHVDPAGRHVVISLSADFTSDPAVWRFPLDGSGEGTAVLLEKPRKGIDEWWADSAGNVRVGMKFERGARASFFYRSKPGAELVRVARVRRDRSHEIGPWGVMGLAPESDIGYAAVADGDGRMVLSKFDFSTGVAGEVVYANPDWDVDAVSFAPDGSLRGATFVDDSPRTVWFDPEMARVQRQLEQALGSGDVRIVSTARTGRMLVWHGSGGDPGVLYVYRPAAGELNTIGEIRPELDFDKLATPRSIEYAARDGTTIRGYLTLPPGREAKGLPLIVMPHGGPYGVRDTLTYDDDVQVLATRGYAVLQPNYRGSSGFGSAFEQLGDGQIGRAMQDDLDDATDWAVAQGIADRGRVCIVDGSYGGFAALWGAIRNPERYRCAASWAGVTDWKDQLKHSRDFLFRSARKQWRTRVAGTDPSIGLDDFSPSAQAASLRRPVLLAHGTADQVVPFAQYEGMKRALDKAGRPFTSLVIKGEGHSFSKPENEQQWYDALIAFLAEHNPAD